MQMKCIIDCVFCKSVMGVLKLKKKKTIMYKKREKLQRIYLCIKFLFKYSKNMN